MNILNENYLTVNGLPKVGTIAQAAKDFSLPPYSIRKWVKTGSLPAVRAGRKIFINYNVLAAFLEGSNIQSEPEVQSPKYTPYVPTASSKGKMPPIF